MGQAKLPVKCDRCGKQGKRAKVALKEGWNRRSYRVVALSEKPPARGPWGCPECLALDSEEYAAEWERTRPEREERQRRAARIMSMLGPAVSRIPAQMRPFPF